MILRRAEARFEPHDVGSAVQVMPVEGIQGRRMHLDDHLIVGRCRFRHVDEPEKFGAAITTVLPGACIAARWRRGTARRVATDREPEHSHAEYENADDRGEDL